MAGLFRNTIRVLGIAALVLMAARADAAPITWGPDIYNPEDIFFVTDTTHSYTHDLTAHGFVPGLLSADQITGGTLEIYFYDDQIDPGGQAEKMKINLEELGFGGAEPASATFILEDFSLAILASLQLDGILNVTLSHQAGDFYFDKSIFLGSGTRRDGETEVEQVPEPATLMLFGVSGLVAALRSRRRHQAPLF